MALTKGSRKCYEWLRTKTSGDVVTRQDVMLATGWKELSLDTYLKKNKLAPFILPLKDGTLKVLLDGSGISERYFNEVFTQAAPRKVTLSPGDRLLGEKAEYTLVEPLGNGAVGHVWSARVANNQEVELVAVKVMLPRADLLAESKLVDVRERFRREARNGAALEHENLVRHLDVGEVQKNPFLVMELGNSSVGRMVELSGALPVEESCAIVLSAADGLSYLHAQGCIHRDVKPDNVLVFDDRYKLADLGIVKWTDYDPRFTTGGTITRASVQLGSWFYMAPEQQQSPHEAGPGSDVYALGVSWIEMLTGQRPSPQAIGAGQYARPCENEAVCDMIRRMVAYVPGERPSVGEVRRVAAGIAA